MVTRQVKRDVFTDGVTRNQTLVSLPLRVVQTRRAGFTHRVCVVLALRFDVRGPKSAGVTSITDGIMCVRTRHFCILLVDGR